MVREYGWGEEPKVGQIDDEWTVTPRHDPSDHDGVQKFLIAGELVDIGTDKVKPILDTELIVATSPSYTRITSGWIGEHGILVASEISRAIRIGVPGRGWADVARGITDRSLLQDLKTQLGTGHNVQAAAWALQIHRVTYWPIKKWTLLPAHLVFSSFDVGHRVVITRGELMGQTGMVISISGSNLEGEGSCVVKLKKGQATVLNNAMAVLRDDNPARLVPLAVLYPPGSRLWVRVKIKAGQNMRWVPAIALTVSKGRLDVLMEDGTVGVCETRDDVEDGDGPRPPDGPIAQTSRGTNPAPRLRPRKPGGVRVRNVPPASQ